MTISLSRLSLGLCCALVFAGAGCETTSTNSALTEVPPDVTVENTNELPPLEPVVPGAEALVGSWASPCLIPDEKSDYAEKHYFTFTTEGSATHKRETFYKKSCSGPDDTLVDNYTYVVPEVGYINLADVDAGQTLYDMYQFDQFTLKFGHGFRNTLPYPTTVGASAADRISTINSYIVYSKVE